ncbi:MAG: epoxyqueuosine reductase QueH, partial [Candidatus Omnitrophica bacterium]|nr:epoxyqueuosine reductase QueH [Candidatus Omnitrophota bacterium]
MIYPLERLRAQGFSVSALFYNPNIHPGAEYLKRRYAVEELSRTLQVEVFYPEYHPEEFFRAVNMREEKQSRCVLCWQTRLLYTAGAAKEKGDTHFTSTLLVSPYQD